MDFGNYGAMQEHRYNAVLRNVNKSVDLLEGTTGTSVIHFEAERQRIKGNARMALQKARVATQEQDEALMHESTEMMNQVELSVNSLHHSILCMIETAKAFDHELPELEGEWKEEYCKTIRECF